MTDDEVVATSPSDAALKRALEAHREVQEVVIRSARIMAAGGAGAPVVFSILIQHIALGLMGQSSPSEAPEDFVPNHAAWRADVPAAVATLRQEARRLLDYADQLEAEAGKLSGMVPVRQA